ncbi:hypothetical protein NDU88_005348 [Pleurodeles waltl]|uniref:Uncharacterized protein n=1 Tax=Pleurodeles waltl TaxID=8319 RepID=A0AAV7TTR8_PLEWA|nr:hypothetical protein NDU88_005348 [Pleurodeles waltl]
MAAGRTKAVLAAPCPESCTILSPRAPRTLQCSHWSLVEEDVPQEVGIILRQSCITSPEQLPDLNMAAAMVISQ